MLPGRWLRPARPEEDTEARRREGLGCSPVGFGSRIPVHIGLFLAPLTPRCGFPSTFALWDGRSYLRSFLSSRIAASSSLRSFNLRVQVAAGVAGFRWAEPRQLSVFVNKALLSRGHAPSLSVFANKV